MLKRAFQGLKHTFMHASGLPHHILLRKTKHFIIFSYQKMVEEDLRHAQTCVSRPETHVYAFLRSSPTIF